MKKPSSGSIITLPNKKLKEPTKKVVLFDELLKEQISQMTKALHQEGGVGLAANQVGFDNCVLIAECPYEDRGLIPLTAFINPEIVQYSDEKDLADEGCLSIPPIELEIERSKKLKVKYQDETGKKHKLAPKGFLARILQHEIDHLNGVMFTDRVREKYLADFPEVAKQKIVFVGSGEFAAIILRGLIALGLNLPLVITEKAKPAGRDQIARTTPVYKEVERFELKILETENINADISEIKKQKPDLILLSDFGQILNKEVLDLPRLGAMNLHPSLLPKYRGASPIASAILGGEKETGVSLMMMAPKIDQGPLLAQIKIDVDDDDDSLSLEKRLAVAAVKLLFHTLPRIIKNSLKSMAQEEKDATSTHKFKKEDGLISWEKTPEEIDRQIRALYPWPGSYTNIDQKRLIIHKAHLEEGKLVLDIVQPEGKNPMTFVQFLNGYRGSKPDWFKKILS